MSEKRRPFYEQLGVHISGKETFDLAVDTDGYPTIHWLIASSMLEDFSPFDRHKLLDAYHEKVRNNLYAAINWLKSKGITVYWSKSENNKGKAVEFLTTDPDYREAKARDFGREVANLQVGIETFRRALNGHPEKLPLWGSETKRFSNVLAERTGEES